MTTTLGVVPGKMRGVMCPDIDTPSLVLLAKALPVVDDRKVAQSDPATGPIRELGQPTIEFGRFKKIEGSKWRSSLQSLLNLSNELYRAGSTAIAVSVLADMVARLNDRRHWQKQRFLGLNLLP